MTQNRTLARRYAVAVGELANEKNVLDQIEAELLQVRDLLAQSSEFNQLLTNEKFTKEMQASTLRSIFTDKLHPITLNFLLLIVSKHRAGYLSEMITEFQHYADKVRNVLAVQVTTAVPLDSEQGQALQESLRQKTGRTVRLDQTVEPEILGGIKVQIGDKVLDGSVSGRLRRLKTSLSAARFSRNSG